MIEELHHGFKPSTLSFNRFVPEERNTGSLGVLDLGQNNESKWIAEDFRSDDFDYWQRWLLLHSSKPPDACCRES